MFKMYLLVAIRKLAKEKTYVIINILGLGLGIGSFLILALYLRSELTFDQHFSNHESIYRISAHWQQANANEDAQGFAATQEGIGPLLVQDYPQLGAHVRCRTLIDAGYKARYTNSGHIVFMRGDTLWAIPFDAEQLELKGNEVPVISGIEVFPFTGQAIYDFSDNGRMIYLPGVSNA